jgi:GTP pyrophosphokinase
MSDLVHRAIEFANAAHEGQTYGQHLAYTVHLHAVANILKEFGFTDEVLIAAGYLHDIIEDTKYNYNDLKREFGTEVAEIVYHVTDELGRNRKERHLKTYPKVASKPEAIIVKLADRIANTRASLHDDGKMDMYKKEYAFFRQTIWNNNSLTEKMWAELDRLYGKA